MELTKIGQIYVDLFKLREDLFNIQELEEEKCIVNFIGKPDGVGGVIHRSPLVLECSLQHIMDLINALPVTKFKI